MTEDEKIKRTWQAWRSNPAIVWRDGEVFRAPIYEPLPAPSLSVTLEKAPMIQYRTVDFHLRRRGNSEFEITANGKHVAWEYL